MKSSQKRRLGGTGYEIDSIQSNQNRKRRKQTGKSWKDELLSITHGLVSSFTHLQSSVTLLQSSVTRLQSSVTRLESGSESICLTYFCWSLIRMNPGIFNASDDAKRFWNALHRSKMKQRILSLEAGTFILGEPSLGNRIYMRQSYQNLIHAAFKDFEGGKRGVIVSGNPGTPIIHF